ncbi:hypothetical protein JW933_07290 [candidate division FCPU426 bacterium]|nr:hypothetical protein [candidate division FCPU426 bacterium]
MSASWQPPVIILVRPQLAENVGAAARAMVNFGARDLRLVNPSPFDQAHAARMACDGRGILERLRVFPTLRSALADCTVTIATSRRQRRVKIPSLEPKAAVLRCLSLPGPVQIGLVFGAEREGLSNEEVFLCDATSTIPATDKGSLNLGQSVLVYLYEWFLAARLAPAGKSETAGNRLASHSEKQRCYDLLQDLLVLSDYQPRSRLPEFLRRVKYLFEERPLTVREQKILLKALRYLEKSAVAGKPSRLHPH